MPAQKKRRNPFYALLVPVGLLFSITACAYGYMAFVEVNSLRSEADRFAGSSLFRLLNQHGTTALLIELAVLAVLTVAAIATEEWRTDSDAASPSAKQDKVDNDGR
ncbi:MAG: hypothetical protein CMJ58_11710 [Planctomycetaceae bacterium]|nr:hypothetical protein [Planctomycetaceae bacterium]